MRGEYYLLVVDVPGDLGDGLAAPGLADQHDVGPLVVRPHHAVSLHLPLSLRPLSRGQADVGILGRGEGGELTNEKTVLRVLTNEKRVLRVLTNERRVLRVLNNESEVY